MQLGKATGLQIAFFTFAVFLLTVPLTNYVGKQLQLDKNWVETLARIAQLGILGLIVAMAERVKPGLISPLLLPVPDDRRREAAIVISAKLALPFAAIGAIVVWHWIQGGALAVEQRFPTDAIHTASQLQAFSTPGLVFMFAAIAIAPLVEEIVFRGLLYRAWEETWGWIPAMLASSVVFAFFHSQFLGAFLSSLVFTCLYRRTGTLVAPIIAHAIGNIGTWYPVLGQFYYPDPGLPAGDLASWWFHIACLSVIVWAFPLYLVMSRNAYPRPGK